MGKVIITCALTGAQQGKEANPNLPEQPEEIIEQGLAAWRSGAAILHIHARDKQGNPTGDVAVFEKIVNGLRDAGCDAVLNLTTGGAVAGLSLEERLRIIPKIQPEIASFSLGSGCLLGRYDYNEEKWLKDKFVPLFPSYAEMESTAEFFLENGTKPEIEIYHAGMINNLKTLDRMGVFQHPMFVNIVMGIPGEVTKAGVRELIYMVDNLPDNANWHVTGIGGKNHFKITTAAVLLGGHLRVGMEDNLYIEQGVFAENNAQLVQKAVRLLNELGDSPASPGEAREILGLEILDQKNK